MDTVNAAGKTPLEVAKTGRLRTSSYFEGINNLDLFSNNDLLILFQGVAEIILKTQRKTSLQCIAARTVNQYDIPYSGLVPKHVEKFIGLHGISECSLS